ncbi:hypothetical protein GGR52DRAFT_550986 [Hypoxylon sp. FL1284]|nr:hypothetical protein GGR52DRAFT_550986 [Hypoxylon sp. FL1284]
MSCGGSSLIPSTLSYCALIVVLTYAGTGLPCGAISMVTDIMTCIILLSLNVFSSQCGIEWYAPSWMVAFE